MRGSEPGLEPPLTLVSLLMWLSAAWPGLLSLEPAIREPFSACGQSWDGAAGVWLGAFGGGGTEIALAGI